MKKEYAWYLVEAVAAVALIIGIWLGLSFANKTDYEKYYENAYKAYKKAKEADTPPVSAEDLKRMTKVLALYRKVYEKYPDSRWADDAIYDVASRISADQEEAFALFRRLINNYPDSDYADDALYTIGMGHYNRREYILAMRAFSGLLEEYPLSSLVDKARFNSAMCYYGKTAIAENPTDQDWDKVLSEFEKFEAEYPGSELVAGAKFYTGMVHLQRKDFPKARQEFQNVIDGFESEYQDKAQYRMASSYLAEGKYDEAIQAYKKVKELHPNSDLVGDAEFHVGFAQGRKGSLDEAVRSLQQALSDNPDNPLAATAQTYIGELYLGTQKYDQAIEAYRKVANNDAYDYDSRKNAQYRVAKIYETKNEMKKAMEEYQKLIKNFPEPHLTPGHPSDEVDEAYINKLKDKTSKGASL